MELSEGDGTVVIDLEHGGRLASFRVAGNELLVGFEHDPLLWGCYPMVPFAGRIRHGRFHFDGRDHRIPANLDVHAIHGYGFIHPWERVADDQIAWRFVDPWPFRGRATQRFRLDAGSLEIELTVTADERQPISMGWHPWFRRVVAGNAAVLDFTAVSMYERDHESIPTGRLVAPPPGPWDDCFTGSITGPTLRWGSLRLDLRATTDHWVVYDEPVHALCVEPQSGPPDEVNASPRVLDEGESARLLFSLDWSTT